MKSLIAVFLIAVTVFGSGCASAQLGGGAYTEFDPLTDEPKTVIPVFSSSSKEKEKGIYLRPEGH